MARAPHDGKKQDGEDDRKPAPSARDQRLKAALRENLRRRKAQARGRAQTAAAGPAEESEP